MLDKKIYIIFFLLIFSVSVSAQIESTRDSTHVEQHDPLSNFRDLRQPNLSPIPEITTKEEYNIDPEEQRRREIFVRHLLFLTPELYVGPSPDPSLEKGFKTSKLLSFSDNYIYLDQHELADGLALATSSSKTSYPGLGAVNMIQGNFYYQPLEWMTLSGGVYTAKYNMAGPQGLLHFNDLGFNASLRFKLHDRIYLRAHGMYSVNSNDSKRNFRPSMLGLYPQSYFGGGVELKITDKVGVEGGMVRELNPMNGKWQNRLYIMPIFYGIGVGR